MTPMTLTYRSGIVVEAGARADGPAGATISTAWTTTTMGGDHAAGRELAMGLSTMDIRLAHAGGVALPKTMTCTNERGPYTASMAGDRVRRWRHA